MKISEIPRHVKLGELPLTARQILRPCSPAFEQDHALVERLASADNDLIGRHLDSVGYEIFDEALLVGADVVPPAELFQMNFKHLALMRCERTRPYRISTREG